MDTPRDYWLALAVYDTYRGVPIRKAVARGYIDLRGLTRPQQERYIRLASLFFIGRSYIKIVGDESDGYDKHLTDEDCAELKAFAELEASVGPAVIRLLDDDETLDAVVRQTTLERLESMGLVPDHD